MCEYLQHHDHFIVILLENRSFDNVFGFFPHVNGVKDKELVYKIHPSTNANSTLLNHSFVPQVSQQICSPLKDPNEDYPNLYECFTNEPWTFTSPQLSKLSKKSMLPMSGFATNYYRALTKKKKHHKLHTPNCSQVQQIVDVVSPQTIPVLHALAQQFALCDNYFCEVPSNTLPNRSFFQSIQSHGNVTNQNYNGLRSWLSNNGTTCYDLLSNHKISWKLYYPPENVIPTSFLINFPSTKEYKSQFVNVETFFSDLKNKTLPQVCFLEPRFLGMPSDYHPIDSDSAYNHNSIQAGEQFLYQIYEAIRNSEYQHKTLLLITFDEGGGLADHVPPPRTQSPYKKSYPTEMNFDFKLLGQRVPLLLISSWLPKNTIVTKQLQHASFIKSLCKRFQISSHMNKRARHAPCYPNTSLFRNKKPRNWPSLFRDKLVFNQQLFSPTSCILPGKNIFLYLSLKHVLDKIARWISVLVFENRTCSDVKQEGTFVYHFLIFLQEFLTQFQAKTGINLWQSSLISFLQLRFFIEQLERVLDNEELLHAQKCNAEN